MAVTISSNIASLNAQRQLGKSTSALQQSFVRLSSGLRINRASDDAAGLAVASGLNIDARIANQGVRNTNDAISLYSVASGALEGLSTIVIRLRELAEQSANGSLTSRQRLALNTEAQALAREYQRIKKTTEFNGLSLLNNSTEELSIQAGYSALTLSGGSGANGSFAGTVTYSASGIFNVSIGDINGDSLTDVVAASFSGPNVTAFLGNSDGTFKGAMNFSISAQSFTTLVMDVNGDRLGDIITGESTDGNFNILLANSDGSFKAARSYAGNNAGFSIGAGDFNGDGIVDVVSGYLDVRISFGNGDGSFRAPQFIATSAGAENIAIADMNGDGLLDLAIASYNDNGVNILLGNGNGSFKATRNYIGNIPVSIDLEDLNSDGVLDVITTNSDQNDVTVYLGNADGSLGASRQYFATARAYDAKAADFNGDGIIDINVGTAFGDILFGNGDGSFKATVSQGGSGLRFNLADVNNDGINDIIDAVGDGIGIRLGNGSATIAVAPILNSFTLITKHDSLDALTQFSKLHSHITAAIGRIGANESRLAAVVSVLSQSSSNYLQAASQIFDVDVATEAAILARGQVLQQAGSAILAQANVQPQLALQLLNGI